MRSIYFSSGPSKKLESWSADILDSSIINRSHIEKDIREYFKHSLDLIRKILQIPDDYVVFFTPGSANGALTCALMNLLQQNRVVECFISGYFSKCWEQEIEGQYKLKTKVVELENIEKHKCDLNADRMLTMVETPDSIKHANYDFLPNSKSEDITDEDNTQIFEGITIVDAVCGAFLEEMPWYKFDATIFSAQKILGGDGSIGILVLSPKAQKRLKENQELREQSNQNWPIPRMFNIDFWKLDELVNGRMMATPSMLAMAELQYLLKWVDERGGVNYLRKKSENNWQIVHEFLQKNSQFDYLIKDPRYRCRAVVCLELKEWKENKLSSKEREIEMNSIAHKAYLEKIFDIQNVRNPSWRFWIGPMQEDSDIEIGLNRFINLF